MIYTVGDNSSSTSAARSTMKQKPSGQGQEIMLMMRLMLTGAVPVLDALLMAQAQGESG